MNIKRINKAVKLTTLLSVGKIAFTAHTAQAEEGLKVVGKAEAEPTTQLTLNQIASPLDVITPVFNDPDIDEGSYSLDSSETVGIIYAKQAKEARLDFIVSNLPRDKSVDVYLIYSTGLAPFAQDKAFNGLERRSNQGANSSPFVFNARANEAPQPTENAPTPPPVESGEICVDMNNLDIIAGVNVQPATQFLGDKTLLGRTLNNPNSVTISVELSDLSDLLNISDEVFFQAVVFPAGTEEPDFTQGRASECDRYIISHEGSTLNNGTTDTGSKASNANTNGSKDFTGSFDSDSDSGEVSGSKNATGNADSNSETESSK